MAYIAVVAFFVAEAIAIGRRGWVLGGAEDRCCAIPNRKKKHQNGCVWLIVALNMMAWAGAAVSAGLYYKFGRDSSAHALANATTLERQDDQNQAHAEYGVFAMMVLASAFRWLDEIGPSASPRVVADTL